MRILWKIIEYLLITAVVAIALLVLASAVPIPGGIKTYIVQSGSMEPAIKTGAIVVVLPRSNYKVGDIVTYGPASKTRTPVTHRIVEMNAGSFVVKGDANNAPDARTVFKNEIIGKVILTVPYLGYAVSAAKKPYGFVPIVVVPAAIIVFGEVKKILGEIKKLKRKKIAEAEKQTNE